MNGVCVECSFSRSPGFSPLRGYQRAPKGRRTRRVFLRARAISLPLPSPALAAKAQWAPHIGLSESTTAVSAVRTATANVLALRRALPFGFLSVYTSRKETTALMRSLVKDAVEVEFQNFEDRPRIHKSKYGKVLEYFVNALQTYLSESLFIYKGIATQDPAEATDRKRAWCNTAATCTCEEGANSACGPKLNDQRGVRKGGGKLG